MKSYRWVFAAVLACLVIAAVCYLWSTSLMDSIYAYRSPLGNKPPQSGQPLGKPLSRRVVAFMIDGLRLDTATNPAVMPFLNQLRAQGASATIHSGLPSYSAPSWTVLATGAWQELSDGPAMNPTSFDRNYYWSQDNLYTGAKKAGLKTAVSANVWFKYLIPPASTDVTAWTIEESPKADQENIDAAVKMIQSGQYTYIFTYALQVDEAGHNEGGPKDPRWDEAAARVDKQIEQIAGAMDLSQDTLLVYSDHGHADNGGHGGHDAVVMIQPFVMVGANVKPGVFGDIQQVDIAPTTAVLLGSPIPAISQGHAITQMLTLTPEQEAAVRQATLTQQAGLYQAYSEALGVSPEKVMVAENQDPVSVYQAAMAEIKSGMVAPERVLRFAMVVLLALIPVYFLVRKRGRWLGWVALAIGIYMIAFHLQYTLRGGTYSMSSVISAEDLTVSLGVSAAVAFLIAWGVAMVGLRLFRIPRLQAVHFTLAVAFLTLYVISLPVLWSFGYNGAIVGRFLPDIPSMTYAFLFLIQMMFVAVLTLPLTGITALVGKAKKRELGD